MTRRLLTIKEVAEYTGLSVHTLGRPKQQEKQDTPAAISLQWIQQGAELFDQKMARLVAAVQATTEAGTTWKANT